MVLHLLRHALLARIIMQSCCYSLITILRFVQFWCNFNDLCKVGRADAAKGCGWRWVGGAEPGWVGEGGGKRGRVGKVGRGVCGAVLGEAGF